MPRPNARPSAKKLADTLTRELQEEWRLVPERLSIEAVKLARPGIQAFRHRPSRCTMPKAWFSSRMSST